MPKQMYRFQILLVQLLPWTEGGPVTRGITRKATSAEEVGIALGKLFERSVEGRLAKIFSEILKTKRTDTFEPPPGGGGIVKVSSDQPDFWLLAVGALLENGHPQGAADVAQVIYNRVASPSWTK